VDIRFGEYPPWETSGIRIAPQSSRRRGTLRRLELPAKTPEHQAAYDAARKRQHQVLLRLNSDEAIRLKSAAAASGKTVSEYVMSLLTERPAPVVDLAHVAQLSAVVATMAAIPKAMRDLEADLGRLSGRLAHFFTLNPDVARQHADEINGTIWEIKTLMSRMLPEMQNVQELIAEPRTKIAHVMKQLMGDLSRKSFSNIKSKVGTLHDR
jgi:uncharacterized protein (DUF1778 family)